MMFFTASAISASDLKERDACSYEVIDAMVYLLFRDKTEDLKFEKGNLIWIPRADLRISNRFASRGLVKGGELKLRYGYEEGDFVQPALDEVFGLTVIEAMHCGLPTFATNQGGPAEIIVHGVSGFHIDPYNGEDSSNKIADFFDKYKSDGRYWNKISLEALKRINELYVPS
ncbi:PREDICTED: sucrose synthase 7-like [Ipomoea nil]|uniref:sucrose synthase 7-like n=1 Tax=Ipomoea nil TaxID=35883 RepID=UPI0009017C1B|nr:PREDICTED: sucrose synthase 7-like [Ipomoea nil]